MILLGRFRTEAESHARSADLARQLAEAREMIRSLGAQRDWWRGRCRDLAADLVNERAGSRA